MRKSPACCALWVVLALTVSSALGAVRYVNLNNPAPTPPYASWATAATVIQDAVDAAAPGDEIVVTNGVYQTGARAVYGINNRVAVTKPVIVRSVKGPDYTSIVGRGPIGENGIRCAYLTNGAVLAGFSLTDGAPQDSGDIYTNQSGGGVWCEGPSAIVSNCLITHNAATVGGGVFGGTLSNCVLRSNFAWGGGGGGGAYASTLNNCEVKRNGAYYGCGGAVRSILNDCLVMENTSWYESGGGASLSTLNNCTLRGNSAYYGGGAIESTLNNCTVLVNYSAGDGGGVVSSTLNNCTLIRNTAEGAGGGAYGSTLNNCTLTGNSARVGGGVMGSTLNNCTLTVNSAGVGGGAFAGTLNNCILYFNNADEAPNWSQNEFYSITLNYSCTTPDPGSGVGNITNAPLFVDTNSWDDVRLQSNSPCINAGNNAYATGSTDLDGNPRIVASSVDMGAYEFQPLAPRLAHAQDGSGGCFIRLHAITGFTYQLERAPSVTGPWTTNATLTAAASGLLEFHDTNAPAGQAFYRVAQP